MSKFKFLPVVVFIIAAFMACEKEKLSPVAKKDPPGLLTAADMAKGKLSPEDKTVDELMGPTEFMSTNDTYPEDCIPADEPLDLKLFYRCFDASHPDDVFHHIGDVRVTNDGTNLRILLTMRPYAGLQSVTDPIDIGFFKTLPAERPSPGEFHYHFNPGDEMIIPINEIVFEDDDAIGAECGEELNILFHVDAYFIWEGGGHDYPQVNAWVGTPVNLASREMWYKYFSYLPCCSDQECDGETAWADGTRYTTQGNWATFTPYDGEAKSVTLYAGQTMNAGTVYFTQEGDSVKIKITLNSGWSLQDVAEAVKIQGYTVAPSGNPNPGGFTTYKGNDLEVTVPRFAFYGVHLDLNNCN